MKVVFHSVANRLKLDQSSILWCYKPWSRDGEERRRRGSGQSNLTNEIQDHHFRFIASVDRFFITRSITDQLF